MAKRKMTKSLRDPRPRTQSGSATPLSIDNTVVIFEKHYQKEDTTEERSRKYLVDRSPHRVRSGGVVVFVNLTGHDAKVDAPAGALVPNKLTVPAGGTVEVRAGNAEQVRQFTYTVWVNGDRAHGASDPDIIIVP